MIVSRVTGFILCISAFVWPMTIGAAGQGLSRQESAKQPPALRHEVSVTMKLVQVYVTDKNQQPVTGLALDDFELFDNGRRQVITALERHELMRTETSVSAGETAARPSLHSLNRKFFFFFDLVFNNPEGLAEAKKAALHFLATQARPDDEVGVISYSIYKGLTIHEYLTTDHQKVREAVEGFGLKDLLGRVQNLEVEYWNAIKDVTGATQTAAPKTISEGWYNPAKHKLQELSIDRMNYQLHARNFVQKTGDLAKALRLIPGYKHIILFSSGIAGTIFQGAPEAMDRGALEAARRRGDATLYNADSLELAVWEEQKYKNMIRELAQANCPVYAFNTERAGQDPAFRKSVSGEYPLQNFSKISGGRYFPQVADYERDLAEIQNLTGSYYVLGYSIAEKWDGKFHEIKVKTRRPDGVVRAQPGYFNPKPFQDYDELEKALHLIDLALSPNPQLLVPLELPIAALDCALPEGNLLVVLSEFSKSIFPEAGRSRSEIITVVFDKDKNIASFHRAEAALDEVREPRLCISSFSVLPAGDYECRVILRNLETGMSAVARQPVRITGRGDSPLVLFTPLLLEPNPGTHYLSIQTKPASAPGRDFLLGSLYPYDTAKHSPLVGDIPGRSGEVFAEIVCATTGLADPKLEFALSVPDAGSGGDMAIPGEIVSTRQYARDENARRWTALLCKLDCSGVKPGHYVLRVVANEPALNLTAESSLKISVR